MDTGRVLTKSLFLPIRRMRRLLEHPRRPMESIGRIVRDDCRNAFRAQRLGELIWAKLYPGQPRPFISIAGAIEDFANGMSRPQPKRFDDAPSLGTGIRRELMESLSSRLVDDRTAAVGSQHRFAGSTQEGSKKGDYTVPITEAMKARIKEWLFTKSGKRVRKRGEGFEGKIGRLLKKDSYTQDALPRPFLGLTDEAESKIRSAVAEFYAKGQR